MKFKLGYINPCTLHITLYSLDLIIILISYIEKW